MKRKDLALHLNLSGETLSRTFRRLEECGLVTQDDDNLVQLCNPIGLQSVADGAPPSELA
jgi:Mn-dependent DtxR family transcriptional regulator